MENETNNIAPSEAPQRQAAPSETQVPNNESEEMRGVVDLFKGAFRIYGGKFWKILGMMLIPLLGLGVMFLISGVLFASSFLDLGITTSNVLRVVLTFIGIIATVFIVILSIISQAGVYILIKTGEVSFGEALRVARKYAGRFFVVSLFFGVMIMLWSLLLIIPGIVFAVFYSLAFWCLFEEDFTGMQALKRSKELVKDNWLGVFGRLILIFIIVIIINFGFEILKAYLLAATMAEHSGSYLILIIVTQILASLISFLIAPFFAIYTYLIYKDLASIKGESKIEKKKSSTFLVISIIVLFLAIIIGLPLIVSLFGMKGARISSTSAKIYSDVKYIQTALELYYNDEGEYPESIDGGIIGRTSYLKTTPIYPDVGKNACSVYDGYIYTPSQDLKSYEIDYCMPSSFGSIPEGPNIATPSGVSNDPAVQNLQGTGLSPVPPSMNRIPKMIDEIDSIEDLDEINELDVENMEEIMDQAVRAEDIVLDASKDSDGDGLPDVLETIYGTDPDNFDTDGDGFSDGEEVDGGYNPLGEGKIIQ